MATYLCIRSIHDYIYIYKYVIIIIHLYVHIYMYTHTYVILDDSTHCLHYYVIIYHVQCTCTDTYQESSRIMTGGFPIAIAVVTRPTWQCSTHFYTAWPPTVNGFRWRWTWAMAMMSPWSFIHFWEIPMGHQMAIWIYMIYHDNYSIYIHILKSLGY